PDKSQPLSPPPNTVQITVVKAQDLKSIKSDTSVTFVRVEYNGVVLGDSSNTDVLPNGTANYNFTASFEYSVDGPNSWVDIAQKPALLTVVEVLQKDKKQKKTMLLGQAVLDLLPLLQGQCSFTVLAPLHAVSTSASESLHPEAKCGLEVTVSTKKPLLSASQVSDGNILSVTLEAAYSVPEAFAPSGPLQNYMACLQVPAVGEKEVPLLFKNGTPKLGGEKEPLPRAKKWPLANIMAPGALNIPNSFILGGPYEDEDGELNKPEDRELRIQAESTKRVVWDTERRCYLDPAAVLVLQKRIAECQYWPVEVCRMPVTSSSKGKTSRADKGDEDRQIFFHGVAYVNMLPLLCPGVKSIRGAFRVVAYQDGEVLEKTKKQKSVLRDLRPQILKEGSWTPGVSSPLPRAVASKDHREDKMTREMEFNRRERRMSNAPKMQLSDVAEEAENVTSLSSDGQQYGAAGTFLVVEIKLDKALVPKRLREELTKRVKEMIPPRPLLPPRTEGAKKAVEDYHKHVTSIAVAILNEYHELFGQQLPGQGATDHQTLEEQKRQLNFELNSSGKYFAFKEQLKARIHVKIVREKYLKTTAFESQEQFQAFLSELYVYLVDQMHIALNQLLYEEPASPALRTRMTAEQLWLFAREAEVNKDYKLASLYHQQRIAQDRCNIQYWLDYGAFCLLQDTLRAQECFREALALDPHHMRSLLLCGIVAVMLQHYEEAEVFFEDACCLEPSNVIAWTLSGLFYELQNNNVQAEMAFREAKKQLQAQLARERSSEGEERKKQISAAYVRSSSLCPEQLLPGNSWQNQEVPSHQQPTVSCAFFHPLQLQRKGYCLLCTCFWLHMVILCSRLSLPPFLWSSAPNWPEPALASTAPEEEAPASEAAPEGQGVGAWLGLTETRFLAELSLVSEHSQPPCTIFTKAVEFLMKVNAIQFAHMALAHELLSLRGGPSSTYYLALAQTCLLKEEFSRCEECLREAVRIDLMNPNVWAQKGHLCYLKGDHGEAKACYEHTVSFMVDAEDMHFVYLRLGSIYLEDKEYGKAKQIYLQACENSASCLTWLGVGIACYRLEEMEEAEDALSEANALNNSSAEVWAYLSLICLWGHRQLEAEQCYKYAVKLGLDDAALLQELHAAQQRLGFGSPA
ncbi:CFA70 protein, partial [Alectura lathami]|nr:CFA70 protein [Alectura lathami]